MFKRLFVMMTASLLFCIFIAAFSLLLFFVNMWKTDRLAHLSGDALSLAEGVASLYTGREQDAAAFDANRYLLFAAGAIQAFSENVDADIFFVSPAGEVILCGDYVLAEGEAGLVPAPCATHRTLRFESSLLEKAANAPSAVYVSEESIRFGMENETDAQYFIAAAPLYHKDEILCFVVAMQPVLSAYLPYTTEFIRMLLFTGLIAVLISFVISLIVSLRMVKPLKKITAATKKYADGDFSDHITAADHYKELAELVDSFNSMAESLAAMDASRSSFVANVSHELKTPITIISGFIDGILDQTIPAEEAQHYLEIVSDEAKRLSRLVVAMLNMSKIEAGKLTLTLSETHLRDIVCRTLLGFEKAISEKQIDLTGLEALSDVTVFADEPLLSQIIYNLIDNAVKFTPDGGSISVTLTEEKKNALLSIRNSGRGIPPEECAFIFDRFYKVDKSRGLDAKSFGMGL